MMNENMFKAFSTFICKHRNIKNNMTYIYRNWEIVKNTFTKHVPKMTCRPTDIQTGKKKLLHLQYRPTFNFWNPHTTQRCTVKTTRKPCFNRKWPLSSYLKSHCEQYVCFISGITKYRTVQCYHSLQLSACMHNYDGAGGKKSSR